MFPRQDYALHLVGWIDRTELEKRGRPLPSETPCYFYPPRDNRQNRHQPGTKTANNYVLPGDLQPITSLSEI
ncbi:hypothetical protein A0U90_13735 (plasmid) [Kozakia baliensis]|nr:hypothetical protein A0U90_13735 [Kozakia baliensis]